MNRGDVAVVAFDSNIAYMGVNKRRTQMLALLDQAEPIIADDAEAAIAQTAADHLAPSARAGQPVQLVMRENPNIIIPLPAKAVVLIHELLRTMASRRPFSIIPHEAELTTQQSADYLNVSRPFLIKLLDSGDIPHRLVGRHRRVRFGDLVKFERASAKQRKQAVAEMAAVSQELGLD
jgi:excisionase family DNA binding protein